MYREHHPDENPASSRPQLVFSSGRLPQCMAPSNIARRYVHILPALLMLLPPTSDGCDVVPGWLCPASCSLNILTVVENSRPLQTHKTFRFTSSSFFFGGGGALLLLLLLYACTYMHTSSRLVVVVVVVSLLSQRYQASSRGSAPRPGCATKNVARDAAGSAAGAGAQQHRRRRRAAAGQPRPHAEPASHRHEPPSPASGLRGVLPQGAL